MPRVFRRRGAERVELLVERMQSIVAVLGGHLQPVLGDLARRVRAILGSPKAAWRIIAAERTGPAGIFVHYAMPLSAIPPVAKLIGWSLLFPYVGFGAGLAGALLSYVLGLAGLAGLALVASKLAPHFEGEADLGQAAKLVAYAATASWIGGIFRLIPVLGIVSLLASVYGCYLLYTGAPVLMSMPEERAPAYTASLVAAAIVIFLATSLILAATVGIDTLGMM
jgi:hypothetical protein